MHKCLHTSAVLSFLSVVYNGLVILRNITTLVCVSSLYTVNNRYPKVKDNANLLISQSKFSGSRKFSLGYPVGLDNRN